MTREQAIAFVQGLPQAKDAESSYKLQELGQTARAQGWEDVARACYEKAKYEREWLFRCTDESALPPAWRACVMKSDGCVFEGLDYNQAAGYAHAYRFQDVPPNVPGVQFYRVETKDKANE